MYRATTPVSTILEKSVVGWQRRVPIRKGARVDSNLVG